MDATPGSPKPGALLAFAFFVDPKDFNVDSIPLRDRFGVLSSLAVCTARFLDLVDRSEPSKDAHTTVEKFSFLGEAGELFGLFFGLSMLRSVRLSGWGSRGRGGGGP